MFFLLERASGLTFYLIDRQASLFVGLAILTGSCLIALCILSSRHNDICHAYCRFSSQLEKEPLTRDELGGKIGTKDQHSSYASEGGFKTALSNHQTVLLERLIYEGKIAERNGKLSLRS